ncbi:hypothetical protein OUZ56_010358 [Daphnia magna]|uniref:Uncharacterized protein n=1 Tax=Daphnia magna TaxID=35525 RepID=A0ABR0AIF9_9CRUS|nr:hypothetical protein OUZ56_010358 [Daphnia magna]
MGGSVLNQDATLWPMLQQDELTTSGKERLTHLLNRTRFSVGDCRLRPKTGVSVFLILYIFLA